jgi:Bacterial regulatory proteins, luxR family
VLIVDGLSNRQIAQRLVISERTVEHQVSNILARLGLETSGQLAVWVVQHGLPAGSRQVPRASTAIGTGDGSQHPCLPLRPSARCRHARLRPRDRNPDRSPRPDCAPTACRRPARDASATDTVGPDCARPWLPSRPHARPTTSVSVWSTDSAFACLAAALLPWGYPSPRSGQACSILTMSCRRSRHTAARTLRTSTSPADGTGASDRDFASRAYQRAEVELMRSLFRPLAVHAHRGDHKE